MEEYVVWEKRRRRTGLCHYSDYYVGRPAQRTTEQHYSETVFELRPEQVTVRPSPMALRLLASTMPRQHNKSSPSWMVCHTACCWHSSLTVCIMAYFMLKCEPQQE